MARSSYPIPGGDNEVVSPELALVDPLLAARARLRLASTSDVPLAPSPEPTSASEQEAVFLDPAADAALRRLAQSAVEAPSPPAARPQRPWALLVLAPALLATIALFASAQLADESAPPEPFPIETTTTPPSVAAYGLSRRLTWAPSSGADAYDVEIFRGFDRIFAARTTAPRVDVPPTWRYEGRALGLDPGEYHWFVWPVAQGQRGSSTMVGSTFTIEAP